MEQINNKEILSGYETLSFYDKTLFISISLGQIAKIMLRRTYLLKEINSQIPKKSIKELLLLCSEVLHVMLKKVFTKKAMV